ncbi:MAG: molybdopterin-binding protein [Actinomycetota bacterium]
MPDVELLDKTEVWIEGIRLDGADLPQIGAAVAGVLSLPPARVFVTDVRDSRVVLDVLVPRVRLEDVAGKQPEVLAAVAAIDGVSVLDGAAVHSWGVLGIIGAPAEHVPELLERAEELEGGLRRYVATRCAVVSTGGELVDGRVKDTNLEVAKEILGAAGFEVAAGGTVADDERLIAGRVARLVGDGYGLVITTGGVGAEDKDRTIEALQLLDPDLATAPIAHFRAGEGRHVKDSVRVAAARVGWARVVALPGPTHEVRLGLPVLVAALSHDAPSSEIAEAIARAIRAGLRRGTHD